MNKDTLYAFIEPNYRTSVCFSKSMNGILRRLENIHASLHVLNDLDELGELICPPKAVAVIGDKEPWIRELLYHLQKMGIHPLLVGADPADYGECVSGVSLNRQTSIEHMLQYFDAAGRTRVALVGADPRDTNDNARVRAFLRHTRKLGMNASEADVYSAESNLNGCIEDFLNDVNNYDGAICVNDFVGVQLILTAQHRGISVPEQLFVAGSGNQILGRCVTPKLTTCTMDYYKIGVQTIDIWTYLLKHPTISALSLSIPCTILCRESTDSFPLPEYRIIQEPNSSSADTSIAPSLLKMRQLEACLLRCDKMDFNILQCVLKGMSNYQIAEQMFASPGTVQYRLKKIYQETGLSSKQDLLDLLISHVTNMDFVKEIPDDPV